MVALKVNIFLIKSFSPSPFKGRESTHKIKVLHDFFSLSLSLLCHSRSPSPFSLPSHHQHHPTAPSVWGSLTPSQHLADLKVRAQELIHYLLSPPHPQPQLWHGSEGLINQKAINSPSWGQITDTDVQ